tara:strand:- start:14 stop:214 length:201 start_codon:yes stop_codon:yes gene_type:complete
MVKVKSVNGGSLVKGVLDTMNKSVKSVNKSLKDPENLLIALLSLVLLALVMYYVKLCCDDKHNNSL